MNRKQANADLVDLSVADVKVPPTTDPRRLAESVVGARFETGLQVVFSTYQSIDVVHSAQELAGDEWPDFDLIICDEAHRTTGVTIADQDESAFTKVHSASFIRADKRLYMTATPRIFRDQTKKAAAESEAEVVLTSMDDESVYGPVFHRLGFGEAVSQGLLTDYKVIVLAVSEDEAAAAYQQATADGSELPLTDTAKLVGCWNALAKRFQGSENTVPLAGVDEVSGTSLPMKRAVAFCKDIKTSKQVADSFPTLVSGHLQDLTNDDPSDNLEVQVQHVDGSMNAVARGERLDWLKADASHGDVPVCRILSNARCLSEGVDVPTLDAVLFLNPRKSQVDVIQAVGRVMRKAPGKELGYIVLPVAIPAGLTPELALSDNSRYQAVWQVLQAIRAHDERFDATINSIELNDSRPENIVVEFAGVPRRSQTDPQPDSHEVGTVGPDGDKPPTQRGVQMTFNFAQAQEWKDSVYAQIVKKVGSRMYWADWAHNIADIAGRYIRLIDDLLEDPAHQDDFAAFLKAVQQTLNPSVDAAQAVEMLAQHLITKPLFDAMFKDYAFSEHNPVSQAMQAIVHRLASNTVFEQEREPLDKCYQSMISRIESVHSLSGKQAVMVDLFDKFFRKAFPRMADSLGIVFTPAEVVDYIIHSAESALQVAFKKSLADDGVAIVEPFAGTGTFVSRLLQSGIIPPDRLRTKYEREIFANEIVLLSYYIASVSIEQVFDALQREAGLATEGEYVPFQGMTMTDTFQMHEGDGNLQNDWEGLGENNARAQRQKQADLHVCIMNPPYSAGQRSANDNNQNLPYPRLDARIADTYAALSTGTNKNSLYDSYFRALRWATDRITGAGVIAFVSNSSFIDGNTADGVRLTWAQEFSDIFIVNLKGNARTQGERRRQEAGNIFAEGSRTGVAITILVKNPDHTGPVTIHYAEVDDYLSREEKLAWLREQRSIEHTNFVQITPNEAGDWINQRDETFATFQPIGDKATKGKVNTSGIFTIFSGGLKTNRDPWCYNFSAEAVATNMHRMIDAYNRFVAAGETSETVSRDRTVVDWNRGLLKDLDQKKAHEFHNTAVQPALYRPFTRSSVYFERSMNDMVYQLPKLFPTPQHRNLSLTIPSGPSAQYFSPIMYELMPALTPNGGNQLFPLYTWEPLPDNTEPVGLFSEFEDVNWQEVPGTWESPSAVASPNNGTNPTHNQNEGATPAVPSAQGSDASLVTQAHATRLPLDFTRPIAEQIPLTLNGYQRRDNITDATLASYRAHYANEAITKEDIFFYTYALLHHPTYRERFAADLKKMHPRIPKVADFMVYANIGRELADLHVNYEHAAPYPLQENWSTSAEGLDNWMRFRVKSPTWTIRSKKADHTSFVYNQHLTLTGIPVEAQDYTVGGKSPLDWVIDRYQLRTHKDSGITNDPNDYCRELGRPDFIVDLIKRLVTVSMRTQELIAALPEFIIEEEQ